MNLAIIGTRDLPGSPETVATAIALAKRRGIPVYLVGGVVTEQLSLEI